MKPLLNGVELVLQHTDASGDRRCHTYSGLHLSHPVLVVLAHSGTPSSPGYQLDLWQALNSEIINSLGGYSVPPPCNGKALALGYCHALEDSACQKLLVLVGDAVSTFDQSFVKLSAQWAAGDSSYSILPVFPQTARSTVSTLLPISASAANATFWSKYPREVLAAIFARTGISAQQSRLFISYRQIDSSALAIQLFDALSHQGFDVFLDHFRIPPGANFQTQLTQELGDKAMVLVLESEHLPESPWVVHEINVAKTCGLGLLALNLPGGAKQSVIDDEYRQVIVNSHFINGSFSSKAELDASILDQIVSTIKIQHDRALIARRRMLEMSFEGALLRENCSVQRLGNGAFCITGASKEYKVWLTTRPPEMTDFHHAHTSVTLPSIGAIVGLSRLMEPARIVRINWLANLCNLHVVDEGQLAHIASQIAKEAL